MGTSVWVGLGKGVGAGNVAVGKVGNETVGDVSFGVDVGAGAVGEAQLTIFSESANVKAIKRYFFKYFLRY